MIYSYDFNCQSELLKSPYGILILEDLLKKIQIHPLRLSLSQIYVYVFYLLEIGNNIQRLDKDTNKTFLRNLKSLLKNYYVYSSNER